MDSRRKTREAEASCQFLDSLKTGCWGSKGNGVDWGMFLMIMILELLQIFEHYQIKLFISPGLSLSWRCVQKYRVPVKITFECIASGQSEPLGIASALRTITVPAPDSPLTSVFQGLGWNLAGLHCQGKFLFPMIYLNSIKFFFNSKTSFRRTCCPVP